MHLFAWLSRRSNLLPRVSFSLPPSESFDTFSNNCRKIFDSKVFVVSSFRSVCSNGERIYSPSVCLTNKKWQQLETILYFLGFRIYHIYNDSISNFK